MERKHSESGIDFYVASSVRDLLEKSQELEDGARIVLTQVSLENVPEPEGTPFGGIAPSWYEVSDSSGKTVMYWPAMNWKSETSGLTPAMRECGRFFAVALELQKRGIFGIQILRIIKRPEPEAQPERRSIRDWFAGLLPSRAGH